MVIYAAGAAGGLAVFIAGILVLRVGRRRLRLTRDTAPHCVNCSYNLTGLVGVSEKCPECGTAMGPTTMSRGRPRRNGRRLVGVGLALLVIGAAGLYVGGRHAYYNINWYERLPFWYVFHDAKRGRLTGLKEIERRLANDELSTGNMKSLALEALARQGEWPGRPNIQQWVDLLDDLDSRGVLAKEEHEQYVRQMVKFDVRVRQDVAIGETIPCELHFHTRAPKRQRLGYLIPTLSMKRRVANEPWTESEINGTVFIHFSINSFSCRRFPIEGQTEPGSVNIEHEIRWAVRVQETGESSALETVDSSSSFSTQVEVHDGNEVETVKLLKDPVLTSQVRKQLNVEARYLLKAPVGSQTSSTTRPQESAAWQLRYFLRSNGGLPCDVAFDVFARVDGREYQGDSAVHSRAIRGPVLNVQGNILLPSGGYNEAVLVLRPSLNDARATSDVVEILDGDQEFGPFELERIPE